MVSQREQRSAQPQAAFEDRIPNHPPEHRPQSHSPFETIEHELQAFYTHTYNSVRTSSIDNSFDRVASDNDYHQLERIADAIATGRAVEAIGGWVDHLVTRVLPGAIKALTFGPTCSAWTHRGQHLLVDWSGGKVTVLDTTAWPTATAGGAR